MSITTEEYTLLFNTITDTIEKLEALQTTLVQVQKQAEEIIISKTD